MPMGKNAGRSSMDYKKPWNSKPGQGKMTGKSNPDMLPSGRNAGQKNHLDIAQNCVPAPGSPVPTQASKTARGKIGRS